MSQTARLQLVVALALVACACAPGTLERPTALQDTEDDLGALEGQLATDPGACPAYIALCARAKSICGAMSGEAETQTVCDDILARCSNNIATYCAATGQDAGVSTDGKVVGGDSAAGADSAVTPVCGDGTCDPSESCGSCPLDCGGCTSQTLTLDPVADAYVDEGSSASNFGSATTLRTDKSPDQQALLRFSVPALAGAVQSAKLRLYVVNGSSDGAALHETSGAWSESGVTWSSRPQPVGAAIVDLGSVSKGWLEIDVSGVVTAAGQKSFVLLPTSSDGMDFSSRESSNAPQLLLVLGGSPAPDGGPPPPSADSGAPAPDAGSPPPPPPPPPADSGAPAPDTGSPPPPTGGAFSFFVVGDTRSDMSVAQQNYKSMTLLDPAAIALFNSGDITADGNLSQWQAQEQAVLLGSGGKIKLTLSTWDPAHIRYFGVVGNHDTHDSGWLSNWNTYLPGQKGLGNNGTDGVWFSVKYGNALFVVLDSENFTSKQTTWLQQVLGAAATDPSIKWRFAFLHHPIYPCNYKSPFSSGVPWAREFEKYGVDMVFTGHAHVYQRNCPMVKGQCQPGGVTYVISGGGGAGTHDITTSELTATRTAGSDSYDCAQVAKAAKGNWHHYCHLKIDDNKLSYNCYTYTATTSPEDSLTIVK